MRNQIKLLFPPLVGRALQQFFLYIRGVIYSGSTYYCAYCDKWYRKFLTGGFDHDVIKKMKIIGAGRRSNMVCPRCKSTDRDRLIHALLTNEHFHLLPAHIILHIAPEPALGKWLDKLQKNNNHVYIAGVKYFDGLYYSPRTILLDILEIPFPDNHFDLIICNHVLEHIEDDTKAINELLRVLKPNGNAILQVPWSPLLETAYEDKNLFSREEREKHFGQFDHVRLYGKDFPFKLQRAGCTVSCIHIQQLQLDTHYLASIAANPKEVIFVVTKTEMENG